MMAMWSLDPSWQSESPSIPTYWWASRLFEGRGFGEFVIDLLGRGWTVDQVLEEYDHLVLQDIQACLAYASEVLKSERVYLVSAS